MTAPVRGLWPSIAFAVVLSGLAIFAALKLRQSPRKDTHGGSRWANAMDLRTLTAERAGGSVVLGWFGRRELRLPAEDNLLIFGVQRSGKTSTLVVPSLLEWSGACVATSSKNELVQLTAPARQRRAPVYVFAPLDTDWTWTVEPGVQCVGWNPIEDIESVGQAAELAELFATDGKPQPPTHWYLSAANLLTGLFMIERARGGDLSWVLERLNTTAVRGYAMLAGPQLDGLAASIVRGFSQTPVEEAGSIISTARSCLSLWLDERVAAATSAQSQTAHLDLDALLAEGGTLYLVAPAEDAERCRPLFSALLGSLLRRATARARLLGGVLQPRLLLALDELANFARVPKLASYVSTGPGQGIQSILCFHDLPQLETAYGPSPAGTIWNNCRARVILPAQGDLRTLDYVSRVVGNETVIYKSKSRSRSGVTSSESRVGTPLLSPDALRRADHPILLYANSPPAKLTLKRWDQVERWRSAVGSARASPQLISA
jgi:type IV secretory pathway TraG/TraD family ATPase VirD4